ncbi:MAG: hypothetical protein LAO20_05500 [Acidobacteriia bacterium]|nr:hypothetical protein [Terriglobia bacterium]
MYSFQSDLRGSWRACVIACSLTLFLVSGCRKDSQKQQSGSVSGGRVARTKQGGVITRPFRDLRDLPGTVFDVTYTPNTVQIGEAQWQKSLVSLSRDGHVFVFDLADDKARQLAPGKVMFLENLAVMNVLSSSEMEGHRVIVAERAGLGDLIQHGKISWKAPIQFGNMSAALPGGSDERLSGMQEWGIVHADSGSGEEKGWHYSFASTPEGKQLNVRFKVSKESNSLEVVLDGKGHISEFMSAASMTIENGGTSDFSFSNSNFSGEFNIDWSAIRGEGDAAGLEDASFKLPAALVTPLPIAGIPFVLKVEENFIVKPGFGAKKELAKGSFTVKFGGAQGISVTNGAPSSAGTAEADGKMKDTTTVSLAPHAILIGVSVPKLSLNLGTESGFEVLEKDIPSGFADRVAASLAKNTLAQKAKDYFKNEASAYVQVVTVFTMTSAGSLSLVPCKLERITVTGQAGADLKILGKQAGDKKMDLFHKEVVMRQPDIKACGEK